jgi:N6-adenosine-specific RNA methylase IME4
MSLNGEVLERVKLSLIDPSPFQHRQHFEEEALALLGKSIKKDGLIQPIVCRRVGSRYELIAGERRVRAAKLAGLNHILARTCEATDTEARKLCLLENVHRDDLSAVEFVQATVDWVDACLLEVDGYADFGDSPSERVKTLLGKMASDESHSTAHVVNKFVNAVESAFKALNCPVEWRSFYNHDLPLVVSLDDDVAAVCIKERLNKSQAKALQKLKDEDKQQFDRLLETGTLAVSDGGVIKQESIKEASAHDIRRATHLRDQQAVLEKARERAGEFPGDRYRVILADPPWLYFDQRTGGTASGAASAHYPCLPAEEICALADSSGRAVCDLAAPDAVIFLWATAPCLVEAIQVVEAWGFIYKAQFVWDKVRGFNGHYNDVQHELLLIGLRGSFPPADVPLFKSIVTCEKDKHSRKPERFYEIIEALYPHGPRLELFARTKRTGWDSWGNEA